MLIRMERRNLRRRRLIYLASLVINMVIIGKAVGEREIVKKAAAVKVEIMGIVRHRILV
jgi:hypothetical protein